MVEVVVPLFNEEENVPELHARLRSACERLGRSWRVTYVDDGSSDRTVALLHANRGGDDRFQVLSLSRNFGHQAAITAGLRQAEGDAVILLDGDLQDPPEFIPDLVAAWEDGAEVVIARRHSRQETGLRRLAIDLFHAGFGYLVDADIPAQTGTFCLLARPALEAINALPEAHRFFPGLRAWVGRRNQRRPLRRQERDRILRRETEVHYVEISERKTGRGIGQPAHVADPRVRGAVSAEGVEGVEPIEPRIEGVAAGLLHADWDNPPAVDREGFYVEVDRAEQVLAIGRPAVLALRLETDVLEEHRDRVRDCGHCILHRNTIPDLTVSVHATRRTIYDAFS
jgi:hypothetical protein